MESCWPTGDARPQTRDQRPLLGRLYLVPNQQIIQVNIVKLRVRVRVRVKVKSQKSKLDPEVGSVMAWPTHHHHPPPPTRQLFLGYKLLINAR